MRRPSGKTSSQLRKLARKAPSPRAALAGDNQQLACAPFNLCRHEGFKLFIGFGLCEAVQIEPRIELDIARPQPAVGIAIKIRHEAVSSLRQKKVIAPGILHGARLQLGIGTETPEHIAAHGALDGAARILRHHQALQRRVRAIGGV